MGTERIKRDVYPRGPEGLEPGGGWMPGEPLVSPEALAAVREEADRVKVLDTAAAVARGEGARAAEAVLARDKEGKAGQLLAFKAFLGSLEDLAGRDASTAANPEETRLVLRLYRLEENGGPKPTSTYQTSASFGAAEALGMGDPDFEGRAQAWAEKTGRFGRYQWRILGWAGGEQTLDTTYNVQVEPPPGYEAPKALELATEAPRDPMTNLREGLAIVNMVKETLGGNAAPGKVDTEGIRAMARAEALLEAERENRKEIRILEDRWQARLEKAEQEAHARGVAEGRRSAEDEYRPRIWELERKAEGGHEPTILEEAARLVGGPEVVQSLVKAVITSMERPPAPPPPPGRPVVPLQRMNPAPPPPQQAVQAPPVAPAAPVLPEPTRKEWRDALDDTEAVLDLLDEHGEDTPDIQQLRQVLEAFRDQGEADGPLGTWWHAWNQGIGQGVRDMLASVEVDEPEGDETMDLDGFKALLGRRLDEGADDAAILHELEEHTTPQQRDQWRGLLKWMPDDAAAAMLGEPRHKERMVNLLRAFQAGQ